MKSTTMKITPAKNPSTTSFELIFLMYNIPKNPVTIIMMIGTEIFMLGKLSEKRGFTNVDRI